jgi:uroporphyrinogen III methyltransferase / synthase
MENPRPLSNQRIIITRDRSQASQFVHLLEALGAEVLSVPVIDIIPPTSWEKVDQTIKEIDAYDWILFTSANAVTCFLERFKVVAGITFSPVSCRLAAIGSATETLLEKNGLRADLVPKRFVAESLLAALKDMETLPGKRFLLPRSSIGREMLPTALRDEGALVDDVVVYQNVLAHLDPAPIRSRLERGDIDWVVVTSSSTANNFLELFRQSSQDSWLNKVKFASIGPITTDTLRQMGIEPTVESQLQTIAALTQTIAEYDSQE